MATANYCNDTGMQTFENIEIKKVSLQEIEELQAISRKTFAETFAERNTVENMNRYLTEELSLEMLTNELANPDSEFYFALLNNQIIGYLKLNTGQAQTEMKDNNSLEIERIYVSKELHGKKVGQVLYKKALEVAKHKRVDHIWLGVWEENLKAINFYTKNGFVAFDKHLFKLGDDEQTDLLMKLII